MSCPHCHSTAVSGRRRRTALGYKTFACRACKRSFNERTGTPFNDLQFPTDVVLLAVLWRLRYKLSFRDVAELLLQRGFEVSHETVRAWEFRFAPLVSERLRARRHGQAGRSWYLDETYIKVSGRWCYLYRAIDRDGNLLDSMLSEHRDPRSGQALLAPPGRCSRPQAVVRHDGQAPCLPEGHPMDRRSQGPPSYEPVPEQSDGAASSADQAAVLPHARVRPIRIRQPFLHRIRRVTTLSQGCGDWDGAGQSIR